MYLVGNGRWVPLYHDFQLFCTALGMYWDWLLHCFTSFGAKLRQSFCCTWVVYVSPVHHWIYKYNKRKQNGESAAVYLYYSLFCSSSCRGSRCRRIWKSNIGGQMKVNPCTCFRLKEFSFSKSPEMKKSSTATVTLSRCHPFLLRKQPL